MNVALVRIRAACLVLGSQANLAVSAEEPLLLRLGLRNLNDNLILLLQIEFHLLDRHFGLGPARRDGQGRIHRVCSSVALPARLPEEVGDVYAMALLREVGTDGGEGAVVGDPLAGLLLELLDYILDPLFLLLLLPLANEVLLRHLDLLPSGDHRVVTLGSHRLGVAVALLLLLLPRSYRSRLA